MSTINVLSRNEEPSGTGCLMAAGIAFIILVFTSVILATM